jgi:hypothetical protein
MNAELCAGAEAPDRHAQVLREVVAVLHEQAGHARERFVERQLLAAELDRFLADDADGGRYAIQRAIDSRRGDDDFLEGRFLGRGRLRMSARAEQEGRGRAVCEAVIPAKWMHRESRSRSRCFVARYHDPA